MLPVVLGPSVQANLLAFIVVYGLDWVATVPPTAALCRSTFGTEGTVVFGWVFASHQIGAAVISQVAGLVREGSGAYTSAWIVGAVLCAVATLLSILVPRGRGVAVT